LDTPEELAALLQTSPAELEQAVQDARRSVARGLASDRGGLLALLDQNPQDGKIDPIDRVLERLKKDYPATSLEQILTPTISGDVEAGKGFVSSPFSAPKIPIASNLAPKQDQRLVDLDVKLRANGINSSTDMNNDSTLDFMSDDELRNLSILGGGELKLIADRAIRQRREKADLAARVAAAAQASAAAEQNRRIQAEAQAKKDAEAARQLVSRLNPTTTSSGKTSMSTGGRKATNAEAAQLKAAGYVLQGGRWIPKSQASTGRVGPR